DARSLYRPAGPWPGGDLRRDRSGRHRAGRRPLQRSRALRPAAGGHRAARLLRRVCNADPTRPARRLVRRAGRGLALAAGRGPGVKTLCRDCFWTGETPQRRCPACQSPRMVFHEELGSLSMAHMDCDAFYASVEKRDRPELRDVPVIVGGGQRGVVTTCCYIARISGVRSAMPMYQAFRLCPEAVVIRPDFAKYKAA